MTYEQMITTENTDERYEAWSTYRNALTDYIISGIEHYYRKAKIQSLGVRRLPGNVGLEQLLEEQATKPVVAIWGAGGGNDIDLPRLAKYFKLVLIDHNLEQVKRTCKRFGLTEEQCVCVDLQFWDITDDDYKMLEAMLQDGCSDADIESYMNEIILHMQTHEYVKLPKFDFSICVGLSSQLNSRLAMLLTLHNRGMELVDYMNELNAIAVEKLADTVYVMTRHAIMYGYEVTQLKPTEKMLADLLTYEPEEWVQKDVWPPHDLTTNISGNDNLSEWICASIKESVLEPQDYETIVWPFAYNKHYIMLLCFFSKKNKI